MTMYFAFVCFFLWLGYMLGKGETEVKCPFCGNKFTIRGKLVIPMGCPFCYGVITWRKVKS